MRVYRKRLLAMLLSCAMMVTMLPMDVSSVYAAENAAQENAAQDTVSGQAEAAASAPESAAKAVQTSAASGEASVSQENDPAAEDGTAAAPSDDAASDDAAEVEPAGDEEGDSNIQIDNKYSDYVKFYRDSACTDEITEDVATVSNNTYIYCRMILPDAGLPENVEGFKATCSNQYSSTPYYLFDTALQKGIHISQEAVITVTEVIKNPVTVSYDDSQFTVYRDYNCTDAVSSGSVFGSSHQCMYIKMNGAAVKPGTFIFAEGQDSYKHTVITQYQLIKSAAAVISFYSNYENISYVKLAAVHRETDYTIDNPYSDDIQITYNDDNGQQQTLSGDSYIEYSCGREFTFSSNTADYHAEIDYSYDGGKNYSEYTYFNISPTGQWKPYIQNMYDHSVENVLAKIVITRLGDVAIHMTGMSNIGLYTDYGCTKEISDGDAVKQYSTIYAKVKGSAPDDKYYQMTAEGYKYYIRGISKYDAAPIGLTIDSQDTVSFRAEAIDMLKFNVSYDGDAGKYVKIYRIGSTSGTPVNNGDYVIPGSTLYAYEIDSPGDREVKLSMGWQTSYINWTGNYGSFCYYKGLSYNISLVDKPKLDLQLKDASSDLVFSYTESNITNEVSDGNVLPYGCSLDVRLTQAAAAAGKKYILHYSGGNDGGTAKGSILVSGSEKCRIADNVVSDITVEYSGNSYILTRDVDEGLKLTYQLVSGNEVSEISFDEADEAMVPMGSSVRITRGSNSENTAIRIYSSGAYVSGYTGKSKVLNRFLYKDNDRVEFELFTDTELKITGEPCRALKINYVSGKDDVTLTDDNGNTLADGSLLCADDHITAAISDDCTKAYQVTVSGTMTDNYEENPRSWFSTQQQTLYAENGDCSATINDNANYSFFAETVKIEELSSVKVTIADTSVHKDIRCNINNRSFDCNTVSDQTITVPEGTRVSFYDNSGDDSQFITCIASSDSKDARQYMWKYSKEDTNGDSYEDSLGYASFTVGSSDVTYTIYDPAVADVYVPVDSGLNISKGEILEAYCKTQAGYMRKYPCEKGTAVYLRRYERYDYTTYNVSVNTVDGKTVSSGSLLDYYDSMSFNMPSVSVNVVCTKVAFPANTVTVNTDNVKQSTVKCCQRDNNGVYQEFKSGDKIQQERRIKIFATDIADSRSLIVKLNRTGENTVASGSKYGVVLNGKKPFFTVMPDYPITFTLTEKDNGYVSGNSMHMLSLVNTTTPGTIIKYNVENGDYVKAGQQITVDVKRIAKNRKLVFNAYCPNENEIATGSDGSQLSNPSKFGVSKYVSENGIITLTMPDAPYEINIWEYGEGETDTGKDINNCTVSVNDTADRTYSGSTQTADVNVSLSGDSLHEGDDYILEWHDNTNAGQASVTVIGEGIYYGAKTLNAFSIIPKAFGNSITTELAECIPKNTAGKYELLPAVRDNGVLLVKDRDYRVSYSSADDEEEVTITGIGNYSGTITRSVKIVTDTVDLGDGHGAVSLDETSAEFDGDAHTPDVTVTYYGMVLEEGSDYTVVYTNNIYPGKAAVNVTGTGRYKGSLDASFVITAKKLSDDDDDYVVGNMKYRRKAKEYCPLPVVTDGDTKLVKDLDYTVTYNNNGQLGTEDSKTADVIITGIHNYSGTKTLHFNIVKQSLAMNARFGLAEKSYEYDGKEHTPDITGAGELTKGEDYDVVYADNVDAGQATATIVGIGGYTGTKVLKFSITRKTIVGLTVSGLDSSSLTLPDENYTGNNMPMPEVAESNGRVLTAADLKYNYKNNRKVTDAATVTIQGQGNYTGKIKCSFKIKPIQFSDYEYHIADIEYTGKNASVQEVVAVNPGTGETLTLYAGKALKVYGYSGDRKNVTGTGEKPSVNIKPKNSNYITGDSAEAAVSFNIVQCNLADCVIAPVKPQKYRNGRNVKPALTVRINGVKLKNGYNYKTEYFTNTGRGVATAVISPADRDKDNFTGSQTASFVIK